MSNGNGSIGDYFGSLGGNADDSRYMTRRARLLRRGTSRMNALNLNELRHVDFALGGSENVASNVASASSGTVGGIGRLDISIDDYPQLGAGLTSTSAGSLQTGRRSSVASASHEAQRSSPSFDFLDLVEHPQHFFVSHSGTGNNGNNNGMLPSHGGFSGSFAVNGNQQGAGLSADTPLEIADTDEDSN